MIKPLLQWRYNGIPAGNGWTTLTNGAEWGRTMSLAPPFRSNIYVNVPPEAKYFYNDNDSAGAQLDGHNLYAVTFAKGELAAGQGLLVVDTVQRKAPDQSQPTQSLLARHKEQDPAVQR